MQLRPYQQKAIDDLYQWFYNSNEGNPVIVLPTGAGKSIVVAELCRDALANWPDTRILMLTHVKELIEQNAEKMLEVWADAPLGIYSAGVGRKELDEPITFASIQSIHRHAEKLGHIDVVLVDECDLISHKETGTYRKFLAALQRINNSIRVIGLTATPYRLGHGYITEGEDALFSDLIEPTSIEELVHLGYLAPLKSKHTRSQLSTKGIHIKQGEFAADELEAVALDAVKGVAAEIKERAAHCKSVLVFCAGVKHATEMAKALDGEVVTGETPKQEREDIINAFKAGKIKYLTNANILTTGFNHPDIDCIALVRPTMSARLYVQMVGRGMRLKSHTDHCLVLDFAGCVAQHGPITLVTPPKKKSNKPGEAPIKCCPNDACMELVHISVKVCPACGYIWPEPKPAKVKLHNDDIMGIAPLEMRIKGWRWDEYISKTSGKVMLRVRYYPERLHGDIVTEYLPVTHDGYAGDKARGLLAKIANAANADRLDDNLATIASAMTTANAPALVKYKREGKYFRIVERSWTDAK